MDYSSGDTSILGSQHRKYRAQSVKAPDSRKTTTASLHNSDPQHHSVFDTPTDPRAVTFQAGHHVFSLSGPNCNGPCSRAECKEQVDKFTNAKFKKFPTEKEAQEFVKGNDTPSIQGSKSSSGSSSKKRSTENSSNSDAAESCNQHKKRKSDNESGESVVVYTDGCCTNNGFSGAKAGIGVYWGSDDERNLSEKLSGRQTNNRAEIFAATRAIQQAKDCGIRDLEIRTDSKFLISCITGWVSKWKSNGWQTANGKAVQNKEELQELDNELSSEIKINWVHVRGHQGIAGNEAADRLANEGATK